MKVILTRDVDDLGGREQVGEITGRQLCLPNLRVGAVSPVSAWQFRVTQSHVVMMVPEVAGELVDDVDGAVLAAGTAHRDCQVASVPALYLRNPPVQEIPDVVNESRHQPVAFEKLDHGLLPAGETSEAGDPIGVGKGACVEHKVGIGGHTVLEAE